MGLDLGRAGQTLFGEQGIELVGQLFQQHGQLDGTLFPRLAVQAHFRDVKKLRQQLLKPLGLVQGNAGELGPLLRR